MEKATEIFEKHWFKATGKPLDETTKSHMKYAIEAIDEALKIGNKKLKEVRLAAADYIKSEGCSCCQDRELHKEAHERLGKLLKVKKYSDGSGRDFYSYASKNKSNGKRN